MRAECGCRPSAAILDSSDEHLAHEQAVQFVAALTGDYDEAAETRFCCRLGRASRSIPAGDSHVVPLDGSRSGGRWVTTSGWTRSICTKIWKDWLRCCERGLEFDACRAAVG